MIRLRVPAMTCATFDVTFQQVGREKNSWTGSDTQTSWLYDAGKTKADPSGFEPFLLNVGLFS